MIIGGIRGLTVRVMHPIILPRIWRRIIVVPMASDTSRAICMKHDLYLVVDRQSGKVLLGA